MHSAKDSRECAVRSRFVLALARATPSHNPTCTHMLERCESEGGAGAVLVCTSCDVPDEKVLNRCENGSPGGGVGKGHGIIVPPTRMQHSAIICPHGRWPWPCMRVCHT